jgi:hypothetical protein
MSLSLLERGDPETDDSPSLLTRLSNKLLGDPRKAPRRIVTLFVFLLFSVIVLGVWLLATSSIDTSGSSSTVVGPVLTILTSVWTVPVLALWLTRRWVLFRRGRKAVKAADVTGWTVETIKQLADEIKTTDGCTRIISSTGDSFNEIAERIDAGLDGEYDDTVDFWGIQDDHADDFDIGHDDYADERAAQIADLRIREQELIAEYNETTDRIDDLITDALNGDVQPEAAFAAGDRASLYDLMDDASQEAVDEAERLIDECEQIRAEIDAVRAELDAATGPADDLSADAEAVCEDIQTGYNAGIILSDQLHEVMDDPAFDPTAASDDVHARDEVVPWRVRFYEEIKHLWLDLQSGFRTGDAIVRFGVPALVAFVFQLFLAGLWTTLPVYALMAATSTAVGLGSFWAVKRRRQRRLRQYRADTGSDYWLDCAGQFKTVETDDVTAYMGFIAGQRYAAYDREEFVRKCARTMHQHVSDECVAPSNLQHYARCLEQMQPNLKGHRENVLRPEIMRDLKQTVTGAKDQIIPKAELAWTVIEQPTTSRIESQLGHDPELVSEEYRSLVDDLHVLEEHDVDFPDAGGEMQTITLVFPAEKNRLPDVSERHSQFSDRFTDLKGDPVYELPKVDPRDDLTGFVPTPEEAALFDGSHPTLRAGGD